MSFLKEHRDFAVGVLASLTAAAVMVGASWVAHAWSLWLAGLTGCGFGFLVAYAVFLLQRSRTAKLFQQIGRSSVEFVRFAETAQNSIFAVGLTLGFLQQGGPKELLFRKLADNQFQVWMLLADPSATGDLWTQIGYAQNFRIEALQVLPIFRSWATQRTNLKVKVAQVITIGLLFIDAEEETGQVVVTPLPWRVSGRDRPCFLLSKKSHPVAFNTYYNAYRELFNSEFAQEVSQVHEDALRRE